MKNSSKKYQAGFSLMEVIVAMTMLALIMGMVYGGIHTSRKMASKGMLSLIHI